MELRATRFRGAGGDELPALHGPADGAPGVLVVHGGEGLDDAARATALRLAEEGFAVLAPDLASRGDGALGDRRACADLEGALEHLARVSGRSPRDVAAVGAGEGGTLAFLFGCASRHVAAVAAIDWPVVRAELSAEHPTQPLELLLNLSAPVLAVFGAPAGEVEELRRVGSQFAKDLDIVVAPGACRESLAARREEVEVFERVLAFLREHLGEPEERDT